MPSGTGKGTNAALILNPSNFETGAAAECIANSGFILENAPLVDERPAKSAVGLGQDRASSWEQEAIKLAGDFNKKFRFGGKIHQLFAGTLGVVDTVSYRSLIKEATGTATGGTTTTLDDTGATFGATDAQVGRFLIINSGTGAYQVLAITASTGTQLSFATAVAPSTDSVYEVVDFAPAIYDICDGTATADTIKMTNNTSMTVNIHAGSWITITAGTGAGQTRGITSNTADTFTVDADWVTNPDVTSVVDVMSDACTHIYKIGDTEGTYFTKCVDIGPYIKEIPHLKIGAFEILGTYDDFVMLRFTVIGDQEITDSVINTTSTGWTIRKNTDEVMMKKTTTSILMNAQAAAALASGTDDRKIVDFSLKFEQQIEGVLRTGPGANNTVSEPIQNNHPIMTLDFNEPLTDAATLKDFRKNNTAQKTSLTITGGVINSNQNKELIIKMPNVALSEVNDPVSDAGFIPTEVKTLLFDAVSAPSGISYTDAFQLEITDDYGGNPIQAGNT